MVDLGDVYHVVAVGEGHFVVGFDDDSFGGADGGLGVVAADAERAVAFIIGGSGLEHGYVAGNVVADHGRDIFEVGGEEVAFAAFHHFARVGGEEVAHVAEMAVAAGLVAGVVAEGGHVEYEHVVVVFAMVGESLGDKTGCGGGMSHYNALAVANVADGFFGF